MPTYPFTEDEARAAHEAWGCNCGPTALAFLLQCSLDRVRPMIPEFDQRRYTSPTMMAAALDALHVRYRSHKVPTRTPAGGLDIESLFAPRLALVRVQWTGPWTAEGVNPKWRYRMTHWITTWTERAVPLVFDCNGGIMSIDEWERDIVPAITETIPKADGSWYPTHIWRLV